MSKIKSFVLAVAAAMAFTLSCSSGNGTASDPYRIYAKTDFMALSP